MNSNSDKNLIIICASGFALEVFWLAKRAGYKIVGFLDDSDECQGKEIFGVKVLGKVNSWVNFSTNQFVIAVGAPKTRKLIHAKMSGGEIEPDFATLIDPSAILGQDVKFGPGSIVCAGVIATVFVNAGEHVIVNLNCTIGHETTISDFVTIAPLVAISGCVKIEKLVEVGTGAVIRQGLVLGASSMLGMGGVLTKNIPENSLFFGSPAKFVKTI
jgi:sugar O-acyltransferase (sialic acid O-acetyltransferase NeuD family)